MLKPSAFVSPRRKNQGSAAAFWPNAMVLPPERPSTRPRPMNKVDKVAMKAGTRRTRHEHPVDEADEEPRRDADRERDADAGIRMGGRIGDREKGRDEAERRADREIELAVHDHEGHADRHHAEAGRVAQHGRQGIRRAEESRVHEGPREIKPRHEQQKAGLPAAPKLRRRPAARPMGAPPRSPRSRCIIAFSDPLSSCLANEHAMPAKYKRIRG